MKDILKENEDSKGFNLVYAKIGGSPKNIFFENNNDVIKFFIENVDNINFLTINDRFINVEQLLENIINLKKEQI